MYDYLLYESESVTLDFKSEQYRFNHESNNHIKAELLKDILAFSNAWRRSTAFILIGVKENKGGKAEVTGISSSLDDAQLQQFVNGKTQRPVDFTYKEVLMGEKIVGVIEILNQRRPIFLKKDYGGLYKNIVYIRRGSSTDIADPDEISEMGKERLEPAKDEAIIQIKEKKLPKNILNYINLGKSLDFVKENLSNPQSKDRDIWSAYRDERVSTTVWNYTFSNADLCLESDDGDSISVITLQTWGEPGNLFDLPIIGTLGEITMGDVMDEFQFDPNEDKLVHFRSMRDGYIFLECYFGRLGLYQTYTFGCYDCPEVFEYELKNNLLIDKDG